MKGTMRNCLILGSGRSGTSLAAGLLAQSGYYMGARLISGTPSNPKGFFEDIDVNAINEDLLEQIIPARPRGRIARRVMKWRPKVNQRWVALGPANPKFELTADLEERIRAQVAQSPYCFKDPRFSYTLPAWRPYVGDAVFVCVFRDPGATINSILQELATNPDAGDYWLPQRRLFTIWNRMYESILDHSRSGDWLFIEYSQLLEPKGAERLAFHTGAAIDPSFPDSKLERSVSRLRLPNSTALLYDVLQRRASPNNVPSL